MEHLLSALGDLVTVVAWIIVMIVALALAS